MHRTSKIAYSGFMPAEACGLQDDVILLCLASSTTPRRRNLLVALARCTVTHFRSSSTKSSSWFLSSLVFEPRQHSTADAESVDLLEQ